MILRKPIFLTAIKKSKEKKTGMCLLITFFTKKINLPKSTFYRIISLRNQAESISRRLKLPSCQWLDGSRRSVSKFCSLGPRKLSLSALETGMEIPGPGNNRNKVVFVQLIKKSLNLTHLISQNPQKFKNRCQKGKWRQIG